MKRIQHRGPRGGIWIESLGRSPLSGRQYRDRPRRGRNNLVLFRKVREFEMGCQGQLERLAGRELRRRKVKPRKQVPVRNAIELDIPASKQTALLQPCDLLPGKVQCYGRDAEPAESRHCLVRQ